MKKFLLVLAVLFIIAAGVGGYFIYNYYISNSDNISKTFSSGNGTYSINTPASWREVAPSSQNGVIAAENSSKSMYMMVAVRPKSGSSSSLTDTSSDSLEGYVGSYIQDIAANSDDPIVQMMTVPPKQSKIGQNSGYYFELDTVSKSIPIHTWDFVVDTDKGFVHVDVTAPGEDTKTAADTAVGIISSLVIKE